MRILVLLITVLFFSCENYYGKVYDKDIQNKTVPCVKVEEKDIFLKSKVVKALREEGIKVYDSCPYTLRVFSKFLAQCDNPVAKSIGADFDGFLRFDLMKDGKILYRVQMDWKGEFGEKRVKNLIKRMKKDIKFGGDKTPH